MIKPDPHHKHSGTCPPTHCTFVCLSGVLDEEGGDVLVNVGLVDKENAEKNVELKKKKPDYKAYEEDESVDDMVTVRKESSSSFREFCHVAILLNSISLTNVHLCTYSLQFKPRTVLGKYDEEIDGEKKKSFRLSKGGCAEGERERELQAIRETLRNQAQSLEMPALAIASEYYTPQEMVRTEAVGRGALEGALEAVLRICLLLSQM